MIKIILADDHQLVRSGIRFLLTDDPGLAIVAEAENGQRVLELLEQGLSADVLVTDMTMPEMDGMALLEAIQDKYPGLKIIFLSMSDHPHVVSNAIRAGASAYLLKNASAMELVFAVKHVHDGGRYLCSDLQFKLLDQMVTSVQQKSAEKQASEIFTEREMEILKYIAQGRTNAEIADQLFLSKRTIEGHRQLLLNKTKSRNSANLIKIATALGLV